LSNIRIVLPADFPDPPCTACVHFQLLSFREKIKNQWNAALSDGKLSNIIEIQFIRDYGLILEPGVMEVQGALTCVTHFLIQTNMVIESQGQMPNGGRSPLVAAQGAISPEILRKIQGNK
jgi:hypothetical protein